jgi:8-oxo-dGTP pyrophosphatase MutT (NUDIX family)
VRPAATVMLLRDTPAGPEVFVLRRVAGMTFAPGMTVFPGGAVDAADSEPISWQGPDTTWWASRLGTETGAAGALVVAAVRELFEETGVLLAGPLSSGAATATITDAVREAVLARRVTLSQALAAARMSLHADKLRPWANWITPPGRTRRYDTFFFTAALPAGQTASLLTTEADLGQWRTPAALLAEREALNLMRPTVAMLTDLAAFGSVAHIMAAERTITPVRVRGSRPPQSAEPSGGRVIG